MQPNDPKLFLKTAEIAKKIMVGDLTVVEDIIDLLFQIAPASVWRPYLDAKTAKEIDKEVDEEEDRKFGKPPT